MASSDAGADCARSKPCWPSCGSQAALRTPRSFPGDPSSFRIATASAAEPGLHVSRDALVAAAVSRCATLAD